MYWNLCTSFANHFDCNRLWCTALILNSAPGMSERHTSMTVQSACKFCLIRHLLCCACTFAQHLLVERDAVDMLAFLNLSSFPVSLYICLAFIDQRQGSWHTTSLEALLFLLSSFHLFFVLIVHYSAVEMSTPFTFVISSCVLISLLCRCKWY